MPEHSVDKTTLERCCVQLSTPLAVDAPAQTAAALEFVSSAMSHSPIESATAVVLRVAWSSAGEDRLGAWILLDAAIRHAMSATTALVREEGAAAASPQPPAAGSSRAHEFLKILHAYLDCAVRSAWDEKLVPEPLAQRYSAIFRGWSKQFNVVTLTKVKIAIRARCDAAKSGATPGVHPAMRADDTFIDALWKLRRESPRPSTAKYLSDLFGITDDQSKHMAAGVSSTAQITGHVMNRKAQLWIGQFYSTTCCLRCDSWSHDFSSCPAAPSRVERLKKPMPRVNAIALLQSHAPKALTTTGSITAPESAAIVLDAVFERIVQQEPYDSLLHAFDTLRGETTTGHARAALSIIASYRLLPSKVAFHVTSSETDAAASPTMLKVREHLVDKERRIREYIALERAVRIVAAEFRGALPVALASAILSKRSDELVFVPLGLAQHELPPTARRNAPPGSTIPASTSTVLVKAMSTLPLALKLAPYTEIVDLMCRRCLDPKHRCASRCPMAQAESHDVRIARAAVELSASIEWIGREADPTGKLYTLRREVESRVEASEGAVPSRKDVETFAAIRSLFLDAGNNELQFVSYCGACRTCGHERDSCVETIRRDSASLGADFYDAVVAPHRVDQIIRQLQHSATSMPEDDPQQRKVKNNVRLLESLVRWARASHPGFTREHHSKIAQLEGIAARWRDEFPYGLASFVFAPRQSEECLTLLREPTAPCRVLKDVSLPMDDVIVYCGARAGERSLLPEVRALEKLHRATMTHCVGISDLFSGDGRRSSMAVVVARHLDMSSDYDNAEERTFPQLSKAVSVIADAQTRVLENLRRGPVNVETVPYAVQASPVTEARRSRSPVKDATLQLSEPVAKANRAEIGIADHANRVPHVEHA